MYNKTDDFDFEVINFPFTHNIQFARICSSYTYFNYRCKILSNKLILRGFSVSKLFWQLKNLVFIIMNF